MAPGASGSGFASVAAGAGLPNGVRYGAPNGLTVTSGPSASTVTLDLRSDPALAAVLWVSSDLVNWNVANVAATTAGNQNGVATGFTRIIFQDTANPQAPARFYRLQLSR